MKILLKQTIALLILASFLTILFYGFAMMAHDTSGGMANDCPFSIPNTTLCPQNTQTAVLHHVATFRSFFNVSVNLDIIASIIFLFLLASISFALVVNVPALAFSIRQNSFINFPLLTSSDQRITRWLAFKTSPF